MKRAILGMYRSRPGQMVWRKVVRVSARPFFQHALVKCLVPSNTDVVTSPDNSFAIPRFQTNPPPAGRHALVVLPFYGLDGASLINDTISAALKAEGYIVHALHYNDSPYRPHTRFWDYSHYLKVQSRDFGNPRSVVSGDVDQIDMIDDWAGDEFALFTAALSQVYQFEICVCNYIFLSRCLDFLPAATLRVLCAHDVFANRNARISASGGSNAGWYFSTSEEEEAKALRRADKVLAIQEDERTYFSSVVGAENVDLLTYVPDERFLAPRPSSTPFVIGYIGSGHYPNVDAIRAFIAEFDFSTGAILRLAGGVCDALSTFDLPRQVLLLGRVEDVTAFYDTCDLFINPDMLLSGMKLKCVEALSFGKPLICTTAASAGIGMSAAYHTLSTIAEVARYAEQATRDPAFLEGATEESRKVFKAFQQHYSTKAVIRKYVDAALKKKV